MRAGILLRTEWIKARGRLAARISVLTYTGFMLVIFGGSFYWAVHQGESPASLPSAWPAVLGIGISGLFAATVVMLLITSEFTWRTARQNVIDGLSREEWFIGKLIGLPIVVALFVLLQIIIGGTFGLLGSWVSEVSGPLIGTTDLAALGGFALGSLGMASLAFMLAFLTRDSGTAIGLFFLYITIGELLLGLLVRRIEWLAKLIVYLPARVFVTLQEYGTFDATAFEAAAARVIEEGGAAPIPPNAGLLTILGLGYTLSFITIAFIVYRRRDL